MKTNESADRVALSVVLPVFNEAAILGRTLARLHAVLQPLGIDYELRFVDDGSHDGTAGYLRRMARADMRVQVQTLRRHAGKEAALRAGLAQAAGRAVIVMDADLQDPPERIPDMLSAWRMGADVVRMCCEPDAGVRRYLDAIVRYAYRGLNQFVSVGVPEQNTDFMLYSRKAVAVLSLVDQRKRYMAPLFAWAGLREHRLVYQRQQRAVVAPNHTARAVKRSHRTGLEH